MKKEKYYFCTTQKELMIEITRDNLKDLKIQHKEKSYKELKILFYCI